MNRLFYIWIIIMCLCSLKSFSQESEILFSQIELDSLKKWSWHLDDCISSVLSDEEIALLEDLLKKEIYSYNSSDKPNLLGGEIDVIKYKYQFVTGLNERGEKEVWVNAFSIEYTPIVNWRDEIVEVNDGGNSFFNLKVNLTLKASSDFYVNGY